jgi:Tfp pilus assembly protein PilF
MKLHTIINIVTILVVGTEVQYVSADSVKARAFTDRATQAIKMGDSNKAELLFAQAMQEDPKNNVFLLALADFYVQQHRFVEAEQLIVSGDQKDYRLWKTKAIMHQVKNEPTLAISAFEQALSLGGKADRYILTCLQVHYEKIGDAVRKKQMEHLLSAVAIDTKQ